MPFVELRSADLQRTKMRMRLSVLMTLLLAGCDSSLESDAKARVAAKLKDPASVQFREVREIAKSVSLNEAVCGEVNAKNEYGGYVGFKKFVATKEYVIIEGDRPGNAFDKNYDYYCLGLK